MKTRLCCSFFAKRPGALRCTAETRGCCEMRKFTPAYLKGRCMEVVTDDFLRNKISWMHGQLWATKLSYPRCSAARARKSCVNKVSQHSESSLETEGVLLSLQLLWKCQRLNQIKVLLIQLQIKYIILIWARIISIDCWSHFYIMFNLVCRFYMRKY